MGGKSVKISLKPRIFRQAFSKLSEKRLNAAHTAGLIHARHSHRVINSCQLITRGVRFGGCISSAFKHKITHCSQSECISSYRGICRQRLECFDCSSERQSPHHSYKRVTFIFRTVSMCATGARHESRHTNVVDAAHMQLMHVYFDLWSILPIQIHTILPFAFNTHYLFGEHLTRAHRGHPLSSPDLRHRRRLCNIAR